MLAAKDVAHRQARLEPQVAEEGAVAVADCCVLTEGVLATQKLPHVHADSLVDSRHHTCVLHHDTSAHRVHIVLGPGQMHVAVVSGALQLVEHARAALDRRPHDRE
eukprot:scaffold7746_cov59-Phaeocystis_antarctica.AAC.4